MIMSFNCKNKAVYYAMEGDDNMATFTQRMWRKNDDGTYDIIHAETESAVVLRPNGRTVEQDMSDYLPEYQAVSTAPDTLKNGKIRTTQTRPYVGVNGEVTGVILERDHPIIYDENGNLPPYDDGSDADTLGGHPASDFVLNTDLTTQLANKADRVHTHQMSNVTGLDTALAGKAEASHSHAPSQITSGEFAAQVKANADAVTNVGTSQIRNIYAGTSDIGAGATLASGDIYLVYE